jgi:hypothetical protein
MIRIAITTAAYAVIESRLPKGVRELPPQRDTAGNYVVHLEPRVLNQLAALRGPGEEYSDVILRLAGMEARYNRAAAKGVPRRPRRHVAPEVDVPWRV